MAKIKTIKLAFTPSISPDTAAYKLYYGESPAAVTYDSTFVVLPSMDVEPDGKMRVDVGSLNLFTDGVYNLGIVAVDEIGNESDMAVLTDVPFDLVAPAAPTNLGIEIS